MTKRSATFRRLIDWIEGREGPASQDAGEPTVSDEFDWLRQFVEVSSDLVLEAPPTGWRSALPRPSLGLALANNRSGYRQVRLADMDWLKASAAGARDGLGPTASQQIIYSSEMADVALSLFPGANDGRLDMIGQYLTPASGSASDGIWSVQLLQGQIDCGCTVADGLGKFAFRDLAAGQYDLIISGDELEIAIPSLALSV